MNKDQNCPGNLKPGSSFISFITLSILVCSAILIWLLRELGLFFAGAIGVFLNTVFPKKWFWIGGAILWTIIGIVGCYYFNWQTEEVGAALLLIGLGYLCNVPKFVREYNQYSHTPQPPK